MDEHVDKLLWSYLDDELDNQTLIQIEKHLAGCSVCRSEMEKMAGLSSLLRSGHIRTSKTGSDRFVRSVMPQLPDRHSPAAQKNPAWLWWVIPTCLLAAWLLLTAASLLTTFTLNTHFGGILDRLGIQLTDSPPGSNPIIAWITLFGITLHVEAASILNRLWAIWQPLNDLWLSFSWQFMLGILYLGWLVVSWSRHTAIFPRQTTVQAITGARSV